MMKYDNFQHIPERLKAYYTIDVPLTSIKHTLEHYNERQGLEMCPDFQRGHVWTREQQIKYIEYILTQPDRDKSTSVVFNKPGWQSDFANNEPMVCVDGLQRITACLAFLNNEIPAYGTYYKDYKGHAPDFPGLQFTIGAFKKKSDVLKWYLQINDAGQPHTEEELQRIRDMLAKEQNT